MRRGTEDETQHGLSKLDIERVQPLEEEERSRATKDTRPHPSPPTRTHRKGSPLTDVEAGTRHTNADDG